VALDADPQLKAVLDGVDVTERQLLASLERHGVKPIDTADGKFDPNLHQAIAEVPGGDKPPGSIVDVVQAGYTIGERLLRPAMVTVAKRGDAPAGRRPPTFATTASLMFISKFARVGVRL